MLCDRCTDRRIATITGHPVLPDPPPPLEIRGSDDRSHVLTFRIWRAPTGIEVELEEAGVPIGEGYHFAVLGSHDANIDELGLILTEVPAGTGRVPPNDAGCWCRAPAVLDLHQWATLQDLFVSRFT